MRVKDFFASVLYYLGRSVHKNNDILSLYFHNPSFDAFEKMILWLQKQGYSFMSSDTLVSYIKGEFIPNEKLVFISFDDGWQKNLLLLPLIEKYGIPVTVFVSTEALNSGNFWWEYARHVGGDSKVLTLKELDEESFNKEIDIMKSQVKLDRSALTIEELKYFVQHPLIEIQSHTHTHPILTNISEDSLNIELQYSKQFLEVNLGTIINKLSYPNGSYENREKVCASKYYECAFSTIQGYPIQGGDLYSIPRIALTDEYWPNLAKINGIWHFVRRIVKRGR